MPEVVCSNRLVVRRRWRYHPHMTSKAPRALSGRASQFRGKIRNRPVVITLTPEGHAGLAAGVTRTGLSRPDYIESLIRKDNRSTVDLQP